MKTIITLLFVFILNTQIDAQEAIKVYKVTTVRWIDNGKLINRADVNVRITINTEEKLLTTDIPVINGKYNTQFKIGIITNREFTGISALIYGENAIDFLLLDVISQKTLRVLISNDRLTILSD